MGTNGIGEKDADRASVLTQGLTMEIEDQTRQLIWGLYPLSRAGDGRLSERATAMDTRKLAEIRYGRAHAQSASDPRRVELGLSELGSQGVGEVLWTTQDVETGWYGDIGFARTRDLLFVHLVLEESDPSGLRDLVGESYRRLLQFVRDNGHSNLLRMWNHFPNIYRRYDGIERYQAFCIGRDDAFKRAGLGKTDFPASTAVGCDAPGLAILLLAARFPGAPVENPRQISAYRYPDRYSPRPPAFARALAFGESGARGLLISGTASVVGHRTMHAGQLMAQVNETIRNLSALIAASGLSAGAGQADVPGLLKVYLPAPERLPAVQDVLDRWTRGKSKLLFLRGDVCRTDLQIEIEGLYCPPPPIGIDERFPTTRSAARGCIQMPAT